MLEMLQVKAYYFAFNMMSNGNSKTGHYTANIYCGVGVRGQYSLSCLLPLLPF